LKYRTLRARVRASWGLSGWRGNERINCKFLPGSARRLELGTGSAEPLSRAYWSQNSGRSAKRLACRARVLLATDSAQAGRGPQWPIHRISAPANDAVRLPGARRLERQMTVPDGRAATSRLAQCERSQCVLDFERVSSCRWSAQIASSARS
jgi:hypothetical protein